MNDSPLSKQAESVMSLQSNSFLDPGNNSQPSTLTSVLPKYQYTREELLNLKNNHLSFIKPSCLDGHELLCQDACKLSGLHGLKNNAAVVLEEMIGQREKRELESESNSTTKRRPISGEARQQTATDSDDDKNIVLVPQRCSFGTGCHVSTAKSVNSSEIKRERQQESSICRERREGHRIGSGRIQINEKHLDKDPRFSEKHMEKDQRFGVKHADKDRCFVEKHVDKDQRFGEQRNFQDKHREAWNTQSNARYNKREFNEDQHFDSSRRDGRAFGPPRNRSEEPEWFTRGPMDQSETIELHGFDGLVKEKSCMEKKCQQRLIFAKKKKVPTATRR